MVRQWSIRIGKKLIYMLLLVTAASLLTFLLMKASPVDPLQANVGQAALGSMSQDQVEKLREYWGVNGSPVRQFLSIPSAGVGGAEG